MKRAIVPVEATQKMLDAIVARYPAVLDRGHALSAHAAMLRAAPALTDEDVLPLAKWLIGERGYTWKEISDTHRASLLLDARRAIAALLGE